MTMTTHDEPRSDALARTDEEDDAITRADISAVAVLNRSEVEAQLDAAHKYPRSIKRFLSEAISMATISVEVAESCIYSLPRGGKAITGPSVRIAEICASAYGNLQIGTRVVDVDDTTITAQGVAWDMEKNIRATIEVRRRITGKQGRFNEDMIVMTGNAAASIAKRNAIFNVVPRAYVNEVYNMARATAVGDAKTFAHRRAAVFSNLGKLGVLPDRVLARVGKPSVEDVDLEALEVLIGLGTSIRDGNVQIDDAFPAVASAVASSPPAPTAPADDGRRIKLHKHQKPQTDAHAANAAPQAAQQAHGSASPAAASSDAHTTPAPAASQQSKKQRTSEPEPPFGSDDQATQEKPARDWDADGTAIWKRINDAATLDALDEIAQDAAEFMRLAPANLVRPVKALLDERRGKLGG